MLSTGSWARMVFVACAVGALGATAGPARSESTDPQSLNRLTVDKALVARHRALGRLGDDLRVFTEPAAIARHRALGRLMVAAPSATPLPAYSSSDWWKASMLAFATFAAGILVGVTVTRSARAHPRATT
jgi:hypothetical protein